MNKKNRPSHRSFSGSMLPPETEAAHFIIFALKVFKEVVKGTTAGHAFFLFVINLCRKWASFSVLVRQASKQASKCNSINGFGRYQHQERDPYCIVIISEDDETFGGFHAGKTTESFFSHLPIKRKHDRAPSDLIFILQHTSNRCLAWPAQTPRSLVHGHPRCTQSKR